MSHRFVGNVIYICHGPQPPTDEDWGRLLDDARKHLKAHSRLYVLVRTGTVGPSPRQRSKLTELMRGANATVRVAVLSASTLVRGIVTALSWANAMDIRSFQPQDVAGALAFLDANAGSPQTAASILDELSREL